MQTRVLEFSDGKITEQGTAFFVRGPNGETAAVTAYRRTGTGFTREEYEGLEAVIPLGEIDTELPLAEIYEGVAFVPEEEDRAEG